MPKCIGGKNGCTCHRHVKCQEGCACYKHRSTSEKCQPDCTCGRHGPYRGDHRAAFLARAYGISLQKYNDLLERQDGGCAICCTREPGKGKLAFPVDHDHVTGKVRGVLCNNCNSALGFFRDDIDLLRKAVKYLEGGEGNF